MTVKQLLDRTNLQSNSDVTISDFTLTNQTVIPTKKLLCFLTVINCDCDVLLV